MCAAAAAATSAAFVLNRHHLFLPVSATTFPPPPSDTTRLPLRAPLSLSLLTSPRRPYISLTAVAVRRRASDEEEELFDEDDEKEDEKMSMREMKEWLKKKPKGFGEGRTYDTSMEEKLLEEIEQSRKAQLANLNKLRIENQSIKNSGGGTQKLHQTQITAPDIPTGIRVRISNLPRKKNIHRDLESAFKGFPGIINISPAVIGNEKTRDPICKGFAFVDLASESAAERFVQMYSKQSVVFGKMQRLITCTIISVDSLSKPSPRSREVTPGVNQEILKEEEDEILTTDSSDLPSDLDESANFIALNGDDSFEDHSNDLISEPQKKKKERIPRKKTTKAKSQTPKLPASLARLKVRERAALTGVLTKYGAKSPTKDNDS